MNGYTHAKKLGLSLLFAFLFIIYVPLACAVGNSPSDEIDYANADTPDTCSHQAAEVGDCENCILLSE